jgi:hypothetical protein
MNTGQIEDMGMICIEQQNSIYFGKLIWQK